MIYQYQDRGLLIEIRGAKRKHVQVLHNNRKMEWDIKQNEWHDYNPLRDYLMNNDLKDVWDDISNDAKLTAFDLVGKVTKSIWYKDSNSLDIFFGDEKFHVEDKAFIDPTKFIIWYMSTFHDILDIDKDDWESFVVTVMRNAEKKRIDPVSPPLVDAILGMLKISRIYPEFCPEVEKIIVSAGSQPFFVHQKEEEDDGTVKNIFWLPQSAVEFYGKREKIPRGEISRLIQPIVYHPSPIAKRVGKQVHKWWLLDFDKMYLFDSSISQVFEGRIMKCEENENVD
jgi:hypothetical protein